MSPDSEEEKPLPQTQEVVVKRGRGRPRKIVQPVVEEQAPVVEQPAPAVAAPSLAQGSQQEVQVDPAAPAPQQRQGPDSWPRD